MSTITYAQLDDPLDQNSGTYAPFFMFGRGLVRDGSSTTYVLTGAQRVSLYFEGEDLEYDGKGRPTDGHVTSCSIVVGDDLQATITDIDIKASKLASLDTAKEFYDLLGKMEITGSAGNDFMLAWKHNDLLQGGDGDDALVGGKGDDRLFGGDGNDVIGLDSGRDVVDGGAGLDTVASTYSGNAADLEIDLRETGFQKVGGGETIKLISIEGIYGGDGDDKLTGDAQANQFAGGNGRDTIVSGAGDDTVQGGLGDDVLKGGDGYDTLAFGVTDHGVKVSLSKEGVQNTGEGRDKFTGFENLRGSYFDDKLTGDEGFNHIEGGNGDDTINGGGGRDGLFGGSGDDVFLFKGDVSSGANIADFNDGGDHDLIDLSGMDANAILKGDQDFSFIGNAAFTGEAGQLRWAHFGDDPTRDILITADMNGDKVVDFYIQLISPVNALTIGDFDL